MVFFISIFVSVLFEQFFFLFLSFFHFVRSLCFVALNWSYIHIYWENGAQQKIENYIGHAGPIFRGIRYFFIHL